MLLSQEREAEAKHNEMEKARREAMEKAKEFEDVRTQVHCLHIFFHCPQGLGPSQPLQILAVCSNTHLNMVWVFLGAASHQDSVGCKAYPGRAARTCRRCVTGGKATLSAVA